MSKISFLKFITGCSSCAVAIISILWYFHEKSYESAIAAITTCTAFIGISYEVVKVAAGYCKSITKKLHNVAILRSLYPLVVCYLRVESMLLILIQKFILLTFRLRWLFVIISTMYFVYILLGIIALIAYLSVTVGLILIGKFSSKEYQEALEHQEALIGKVNQFVSRYIIYAIRISILICLLYCIAMSPFFKQHFL